MMQGFIHHIRRIILAAITLFSVAIFASCGGSSQKAPAAVKDFSAGTIKAHASPVTAVLFTPDGKQIISAGRDGRLLIWDVGSKTAVVELLGKGDQLRSAVLTLDGKFVAAGNEKGIVSVFDLESHKLIQTINADSDSILAVAFDSKGKMLITGGKDKQVKVWTVGADSSPKHFEGSFDRIDSVAFSADDKKVYAGSSGTGIRIWRFSDAKAQDSRFQYNGEIYCIVFDKERGLIIAGGTAGNVNGLHDGKVKIWRYSDGKELLNFAPHRLVTSAVAVSNQNNILATASTTDSVIRLWDLSSGEPAGTLIGHSKGVNSVCFNDDGRLLASGGEDGTVKIWTIPHH
jgi:WD40 repeat protein